jgi:tRNA (guanine-N7-)-methyltransferase
MREFQASLIPKPSGWSEFNFPNKSEIDLEIGCGVGLHPIRYSMENPERFLIALEHTQMRFEAFSKRYESHNSPSNLLPVQANAIHWITHFVPQSSISRIFLLYPNPYPKKKHLNQRWYAMSFMERLISVLKPGGELTLASNLQDYADGAKVSFENTWGLRTIEKRELTKKDLESGYRPRTHFEKKYLLRGDNCWNLRVQKPA